MKKLTCSVLSFIFFSSLSYANEPFNLNLAKQKIKIYHDSGAYDQDLKKIDHAALTYLKLYLAAHPNVSKPAIVFDIDETALSNYPTLVKYDFGGTLDEIRNEIDKGKASAIKPTLALYDFAHQHHVALFFITGREEKERAPTIANLHEAGYDGWQALLMRAPSDEKKTAAVYKTTLRHQLADQGYDIILNIGDQQSDLDGKYARKTFKLPNPFYYIA